MNSLLIALTIFMPLMGCSKLFQPTQYQPLDYSGGFSEVLTGQNTAKVSFHSNEYTSIEQTYLYALRRASEITIELGYDYFLIETNNQFYNQHKTKSTISCYTGPRGQNTNCYEAGGNIISKPVAQLEIRMFRGKTPNTTGYYDAWFSFQNNAPPQ